MIALDTNILVYAHRRDGAFHRVAAACVEQLAESRAPWAIPWPCVHEFFAVVTSARIFNRPTSATRALAQIRAWMESPSLALLGEADDHISVLNRLVKTAKIQGPVIHDARVAAICIAHGVRTLWSADRDFSRFPELETLNPLVAET